MMSFLLSGGLRKGNLSKQVEHPFYAKWPHLANCRCKTRRANVAGQTLNQFILLII